MSPASTAPARMDGWDTERNERFRRAGVARSHGCIETPDDGTGGGSSGGACCPGTACGVGIGSSSTGCAIASSTRPQDGTCPPDEPSRPEPRSAARLGLGCSRSDWARESGGSGIWTRSYHGWSCTNGFCVQ